MFFPFRRLLFLLLTSASTFTNAQDRRFHVVTGAALNYVSKVDIEAECASVVLPHVAVSYSAPMSPVVSVKTGLVYQQKGFRSQTQTLSWDPNVFNGERRFHFISVPLELSGRLLNAKNHQLFLSGGMSYAFLFKVHTEIDQSAHSMTRLTKQRAQESDQQIGLFPPSSPVKTAAVQFNLFNPMVIQELSYVLRNRYVARLFHEYALYDIAASDYKGTIHLHSAGVSFGVAL